MAVFGSASRQSPFARRQIKLGARHAGDFADTLAGQEAKLDDALALDSMGKPARNNRFVRLKRPAASGAPLACLGTPQPVGRFLVPVGT
jgi:hypothetical protein